MKVFVSSKKLADIMKSMCKIARPKSMNPIMSHVAVSFDDGLLTVTANDGKRTLSEWVPAEGDAGRCTIDADKLLRACSAIGDHTATLEPDSIKGGKAAFKLSGGHYSEFPQPDYEAGRPVGVTAQRLCCIAKELSYATPSNHWRTMINGLHLGGDCAAATDSFVLAWRKIDYSENPITIPSESVRHLSGMSGKVLISDSMLIIDGSSSRFTTTLLSEKYPDWPRMIPAKFDCEIAICANEFVDAMRAAQVGGEKAQFKFTDGHVEVSNSGSSVTCDCAPDSEFCVGFHLQYMIDTVLAAGKNDVTLKLNSVGPSMVDDQQLIMPVKF